MLFKAVNCASIELFRHPDGTPLKVTKRSQVCLYNSLDDVHTELELSIAYFSTQLTNNLMSHGRLTDLGCLLGQYQGRHAVLKYRNVGFYVKIKNHVVVVDRSVFNKAHRAIGEVVMSAVAPVDYGPDVHMGTLTQFRQRFGNLG